MFELKTILFPNVTTGAPTPISIHVFSINLLFRIDITINPEIEEDIIKQI